MLALARATLERQDLGAASKALLQQNLYAALLAADQVEAGVAELRKQITQPPTRPNRYSRTYTSSPNNSALLLARLGVLESRPEWSDEGIAAVKKALAEPKKEADSPWSESSPATELAGLLVELGRPAEAEAILMADARQTIAQYAKLKQNQRNVHRYTSDYSGNNPLANQLGALLLLYHQAGRPADVLALLEHSPDWGVNDLAELSRYNFASLTFNERGFHGRSHGLPVQFIAAAALAKTGRTAEAKKILAAVLQTNPGLDAAYALLLEIGSDDVPAQLDALFAQDRFEERPLIWKAEWLRRKGDLEAADKICRQAISIDPSDGEQGPDDRMRAYAVLADIRAARGDAKEADFFRGAVSAIRLSERADKFTQAGLMKRAVAMYEESLTKFADAYCIQSRLAVQLAEMGRHEEAEAHYRKAYELMPESFGRVESHCFGCERAFDGQRAQSLAEKVFTDLAVKTPNKPQVHYLLGYLRAEQERYQEAVTNYQRAVALDPDYLNAWVKIQELTAHVRLATAQRDDLALNILRLDPASRHSCVSLGNVADLRRFWLAVAGTQKLQPVPPKSLYVLAASKAELQKNRKQPADEAEAETEDELLTYWVRSAANQSPATMLRNNTFIQTAGQLMSPMFTQVLNAN
jgi:tetratricopeptide (TPR) repeat protein